MPYIARVKELPEIAVRGGLVDPRADHQHSFNKRISCQDVTDFISNTAEVSPLELRDKKAAARHNSDNRARLYKILARTNELSRPLAVKSSDQPISDLLPGLVVSGGLSRSPAFDCIPVVSHWGDRTDEYSAVDPAATVCLTSTWRTTHVRGEGLVRESPHGAPCWALQTHGISPTEAGSPKFSQQYVPETDTLTTTVNLARRTDTALTKGVLGAAASISWMRNARVADAADCAIGLLSDAAALLEARDKMITSGASVEALDFAEVRAVEVPSWCVARKPLAPKLSGVADSPDQATDDLFARELCEGPLINTSIFSMSMGYNRGVYGGSISGLWAVMDSAFVLDYSIGTDTSAMADRLSFAFAEVTASAEASASAGPHIDDIRIVKGCNYGCVRQKTIIEDNDPIESSPCMVVWNDLDRLARYKLADAVFCHVYYDSGGGEQMAAIAGLGCVAHDWIDLGPDMMCGEVSNIIPSLTRGSLEENALAEVYARLIGAMIWYRNNDPYNPAALCLLFTHWWQLSNCRHRPITLLGRTDLDVTAAISPIMPEGRPELEHFRSQGTRVERGEGPLSSAEARLEALLDTEILPETRAVVNLLVNPVLAYVKGGDSLPAESEFVGAVLTAELAYPHGQKIMELWDLAIVMWECGAMWAAGVAGLCYTHTGKANCDRARHDLADHTWT
ncbi:hypothetical protein N7462_008989 [Penicillium macrosclerotiorum]|uniref:uncharacterized protein n=1 Tax=Penicillium macrosclerotiorum TaxID=303699 RepID=UPI0025497E0E|nr:uncharacterized protein N7462_008989 [Penicillium macrosclerotiorum]KAJ5676092.1 hypothetical protein N7462_008989 [Penicillium macrosclerotiorum]